MGYEINIDKYGFAQKPNPEKNDECYSAALAKKLVSDESKTRSAGEERLKMSIADEASKNAALFDKLDSDLKNEIQRSVSSDEKLSNEKVDKEIGMGLSKIQDVTLSTQIHGKINIQTLSQDGIGTSHYVYQCDEIDNLLGDKQNCLIFDETPTVNSTNPVTSGGIYKKFSDLETSTHIHGVQIAMIKDTKADKTIYDSGAGDGAIEYNVKEKNNHVTSFLDQSGAITSIAISIPDGVYSRDYISGMTFLSGSTPPEISYSTNPWLIRWVGEDCTTQGEYSIFSPVANKVYEIMFTFNGSYIVCLVVGYDSIV